MRVAAALITLLAAASAGADCPTYSEDSKAVVLHDFEYRDFVVDAAIVQEGCQLNLAIIVGYAANEEYSRELADNMVRMTKAFGAGPGPRKMIGKGIYDYFVGVYYPDETRVVLGFKGRGSDRIAW